MHKNRNSTKTLLIYLFTVIICFGYSPVNWWTKERPLWVVARAGV